MSSHALFQEAEERLDRSLQAFMNSIVRATGYPKEKLHELWIQALDPKEPKEEKEEPTTPPPSPALAPVTEKAAPAPAPAQVQVSAPAPVQVQASAPEKPPAPAPVQAPAQEKPPVQTETKPRCVHLMTRGKNEGKECGNPSKSGSSYCAKHQPSKVILEDEEKPAEKVEKPVEKVEKPAEKVEKPVEKVEKPVEKVEKPVEKVEKQEEKKEEKPEKPAEKKEEKEKKKKVVPEKQLQVKEYDQSFEAATVMTVTEAKRLDARIKDREFNLQKSYPPVEIVAKGPHRVIAGTDVVVDEKGAEILGYLEGGTFVRSPNRATDRATVDYGLPFNSDGVEIDE
jgi:hypothetical protein